MEITYDKKSFIIDGKRIWLFIGEIHYFRFPASEWREVIKKAKAAGINTISTYLAWNYHELSDGQFDFSGDRDFAQFVDIAKEEGMYVFLRPGPYICAEWSGGGIPIWLLKHEKLVLRVTEDTFMHYAKRWLCEAMKFAVPRLVTNGGNIIAVQNDNEYPGGWDKLGASYIEEIYNTLRTLGVDVPITACNAHCKNGKLTINYSDYDVIAKDNKSIYKDMIVTYNTAGEVYVFPQLRELQPNKPIIVTELWTGAQVFWGRIKEEYTLSVKSALCRMIALGAEVNLYMFAGGTNFAYNGGKNIATSYASSYPIGDANIAKEQYYQIKPLGFFQESFAEFLAESESDTLVENEVYSKSSEKGSLVFVVSDRDEYTYEYKSNVYTVSPDGLGYGIYPHDFTICGCTINRSNASLLGRSGRYLFLTASAGINVEITVNGKNCGCVVPHKDVAAIDADGITLIILGSYFAQRVWQTKNGILIGYDMAYDTDGGVHKELKNGGRVVEITDSEITRLNILPQPEKPAPAELMNWEILNSFDTYEFKKIDSPLAHHALNIPNGYVWYRAKASCEHDGCYQMMVSSFLNRILVYVNGSFCGIFGDKRNSITRLDYTNPTDAVCELITIRLSKGENEILFLSEDTGYGFDDPLPMGILSDVYFDARLFYPEDITDLGRTPITAEAADYMYSVTVSKMTDLNTLEFDVDLKADEELFLVCHAKPCFIYVNDAPASPIKIENKLWHNWRDFVVWQTFRTDTHAGKNRIRIQYYCGANDLLAHIKVYIVKKASRLHSWEYSAFCGNPEYHGRTDFKNIVMQDSTLLVPCGEISAGSNDFTPKYFTAKFKNPSRESFMLSMGDMRKGQIFLNGKNVGKFNGNQTQALYYLPAAYMLDENILTVFEEYGTQPQNVKLKRP